MKKNGCGQWLTASVGRYLGTQSCTVFGFQSTQYILNDLVGFLIGEGMIGVAQGEGEGNALLAFSDLSTAVDVKQLQLFQLLLGGLP